MIKQGLPARQYLDLEHREPYSIYIYIYSLMTRMHAQTRTHPDTHAHRHAQRERDIYIYVFIYLFIYLHIIYIYIYMHIKNIFAEANSAAYPSTPISPRPWSRGQPSGCLPASADQHPEQQTTAAAPVTPPKGPYSTLQGPSD